MSLRGIRGAHFSRAPAPRRGPRRPSSRGVEDIVATILLLGLTVVIFASILAFVIGFPVPLAQNSSQFTASFTSEPNGTGTAILALSIAHASGPVVPASALVYLKSSLHPKGPEFQNPYTLAAGGIPAGKTWNPGETFVLNTNFTGGFHPVLPDNITIYVISGTSLLFSAVLPGTAESLPPVFYDSATSPVTPAVGESFNISVRILNIYSFNNVYVNLTGLPGTFVVLHRMVYIANVWNYTVPAGWTTASGQFYVVVNATTTGGVLSVASIPVYITPYSTLITHTISLGAASSAGTCTGAAAPVAACQASGDYYYVVPILYSPVTFGSVLFEVLTSSGSTYAGTTHGAFAVSTTAAPGTSSAKYVAASPYTMLMPSSGFTTYAAGFTGTTPLTSAYEISIDTGTVNPAGGGNSFVVIGIGSYSGQTIPDSLP
jgi:hypothetical protein